jgi:hypothetical protein
MRVSLTKALLCVALWVMLCTHCAAEQIKRVPIPEPYVEVTGRARGLKLFPAEAGGYRLIIGNDNGLERLP